MKNCVIYIVLLLLPIISCKKENPPVYSSDIMGNWFWIESCGGIAGDCGNPATLHYTMKLSYTPDSVEKVYQSDTLISTRKFIIHSNIISFDSSSFRKSFLIRRDSLFLYTIDISDGYQSTYKRIK